jgi:hypothetical protein
MNPDTEPSANALEGVAEVARLITARGLPVYRCEFDFLAFGSWTIETGTRHRRIRIVYDGKEHRLCCSTAALENTSSIPTWQERETIAVDRQASAAVADEAVALLERCL